MNYFTKDKPYNSLNEYYKKKYNTKIAKIAINASFTCPNKDGTKSYLGCSFCSNGSGEFAGDSNLSIKEQFLQIKKVMDNKWKNTKYILYFQANSNTYAKLEKLKEIYNEALNIDNVVGIDIATRSDCLNEEIVKYLSELNKIKDITVELGLQTSNEKTKELINRQETNQEFIDAVNLLRKYNIEVVCHIINGLPYETTSDMLNTIDFINNLDIQGVKFHSLLILKNTRLEKEYYEKNFHILSLEEYVSITVAQIVKLKPSIIIHRLSADSSLEDLITPSWTRKKFVVMNEIDKKLRKENLYQGKGWSK